MTGKTNQLVNEIKRKLVSRVTKNPEFKSTDEVVKAAVINYYNQLKRDKLL